MAANLLQVDFEIGFSQAINQDKLFDATDSEAQAIEMRKILLLAGLDVNYDFNDP